MKTLSLIISFIMISSAAFASEFKIAVVDLQKALQTVEAGKKAKASLEKEFNEKKKVLESEENTIKKMTEDFKKQSLVLSEDAKIKKQNEIQERVMKYRELFGKSQMEIQGRERELTDPIIQKLKGVVEEMGNKKGYTMIVEKNENAILFSSAKEDLTDEVIKEFNKKPNG